jgi:hypothetical protein
VLYHRRTGFRPIKRKNPMKNIPAHNRAGMVCLALALSLLSACAGTATPPPAQQDAVKTDNDFPTLARVEYVMQCMQEHGGQNYDNLYHCVCSADKIASQMPYEEFAQAQTFIYLFNMPGERGGQFRDPPQSAKLRNRLKEVKAQAAQACFPKTVKNPKAGN